jgi:hypothetical protein
MEWQKLRSEVITRLGGNPQAELAMILGRIDVAEAREATDEAQAVCLGTPLGIEALLRNRHLLYFDEQRTDTLALASWPPVATQRSGTWNEAEFHRELAADLLDRACSSSALAAALARRAAGESSPGDLEFDLELANQLLQRQSQCKALQEIDGSIKRQISWRVRRGAEKQGQF